MNQKEALTILLEETVDKDHDPNIREARAIVAARIEVLRQRYTKFHLTQATGAIVDTEDVDLGIGSKPIKPKAKS